MHFRLDFTDILNFIKFTLRYPLSPLNISPCDFSAREMLTLVVCTRIQSDADVPKRRLDAKYANYTRRHTEHSRHVHTFRPFVRFLPPAQRPARSQHVCPALPCANPSVPEFIVDVTHRKIGR